MNRPWSYSSLKTFRTCARKYHAEKVIRIVPFEETDATIYGKAFHKAAEDFIRDGTPIPERYSYAASYLETIRAVPGTKHCEFEMALGPDMRPCKFADSHAWVRGIADLLVIPETGTTARLLDYKTGKNAKYADPEQLKLMALMVFVHFPHITKVRAGLLFTVAKDFIPADYERSKISEYWSAFMPDVARLEGAYESDVWNPTPNGLCKKWCKVPGCEYRG